MNKTDAVNQVVKNTGLAADLCGQVIKAFEEQTVSALENRLRGMKSNQAEILTVISRQTDVAFDDCETIIESFEEVLSTELANKLRFFK